MMEENEYRIGMTRAVELAEEALEAGEAPVGAVLMRDGQVVAEAREAVTAANDPAGHAELLALRAACQSTGSLTLPDCVLYTTVEPCLLCAFAIRATGIPYVVIGVPVEGIGGATSAYPILTDPNLPDFDAPPQLIWGVLEAECTALMQRRALLRAQENSPAS